MKRAQSRPSVAILGCGAVGKALAVELLARGSPVRAAGIWVWSRRRRSVSRLRALVEEMERGSARRVRELASPEQALVDADVVLLSVADGGLGATTKALARGDGSLRGKTVLFTNGWWPVEILAPLQRRGCAVGRMHPLAPVPDGAEHLALTGAWFGLEGDTRALAAARRIVRGIRGRVLLLRPVRGAYHAGASLLGGGLVALLKLAEDAMASSVRSRSDLREALTDFVEQIAWNVYLLGPEGAVTGALARGSETLVDGHLRALHLHPEAKRLYRCLGGPILKLARRRGSIDASNHQRLTALLNRSRSRKEAREGRPRRRLDESRR